MITPINLATSSNHVLDTGATRSAQLLIQGDDASVVVLEVSADGAEWSATMPEGKTTLVNIGAFSADFAQGFSYRLTNDGTAAASVFISPQ